MSLLLWALLIWIAPALVAGAGLLWFVVIAPRFEKTSRPAQTREAAPVSTVTNLDLSRAA